MLFFLEHRKFYKQLAIVRKENYKKKKKKPMN